MLDWIKLNSTQDLERSWVDHLCAQEKKLTLVISRCISDLGLDGPMQESLFNVIIAPSRFNAPSF